VGEGFRGKPPIIIIIIIVIIIIIITGEWQVQAVLEPQHNYGQSDTF
jgi:hypothetical protein